MGRSVFTGTVFTGKMCTNHPYCERVLKIYNKLMLMLGCIDLRQ